jgi:drug/metabolite transporter (DMT)-like permease
MSSLNNSKILIPLAFFAVYVVWGSTYLFVAYAVEEIPPFLLSGIRYIAAAFILLGFVAAFKQFKGITSTQVKNSFFAGIMLLGIGSGGVAWALQRLDSGFTALLIATQPLVTLLMMWAIDKERPENSSFFGIFLGMIGAYLLLSQDTILATTDQWIAVLIVFICLFVWAYATIFINKGDMPKAFMANTGIQLISGGIFAYIFSYAVLQEKTVVWSEVSQLGWISLLILIVLGGAVVFVAFNYLLKQTSPEKVATTTYVNPVIALALGWWFRDELVTTQSVIAATVMLTGVVFINFEWEKIKGFFSKKNKSYS